MPSASSAGQPAAEPFMKCLRCGAEIKLTESLRASVMQEETRRFESERAKLVEDAKAETRREFELKLKSADEESANQRRRLVEFEKNELALRKKANELEERNRTIDLEVQPRLGALVDALYERVPAGVGARGFVSVDADEFQEVMREGARWALRRGYGSETTCSTRSPAAASRARARRR